MKIIMEKINNTIKPQQKYRQFYFFCFWGFYVIFPVMMALQCSKSGWTPAKNVSVDESLAINNSAQYNAQWIKMSDDAKLYERSWLKQNAGCNILFLHCMSTHSGLYGKFAMKVLEKTSCNFYALDLRGFGKSGKPGDIEYKWTKATDRIVADICSALNLHADLPLFLTGYSLGASFSIKALQTCDIKLEGLLLLAPGIELATPNTPEIEKLKSSMFWKMIFSPDEYWDSSIGWVDEIKNGPMGEMMKNDKLCAINMTYRFSMIFIGIQKSNLMRSAKKIQTPVLVVQGKNDTVVKPQASRDFFETLASVDKNILEPDTGHDLGGLFFSDTEIFNSESVFRFLQIK